PCISCFSYMIGITAFSSLAAIYIVEVLGGSRFLWGISATLGYVLGAVAIAPTGRLSDRVGRKPIIRAGLLAQIVLFVSFLFFRDPLLVALLYVAPLVYVVCTTITTLVTDVTSERERGKAVGIQNSWLNAGGVAGPLLGGALAQGLGIGVVFPFAIAMVLFSVIWAQLTVDESKPKDGAVKKALNG
ncbi:MAG: MFS transporter, partial [Thaumarchaeota archaeon]